MSDLRGEHAAAVDLAKQSAGEMQELCSLLTDKQELLLAQVQGATGGSGSNSQSGQAAYQRAALVQDRINDLNQLLGEVITELDAYSQGI